MGFFDALLGRRKLKGPDLDALFAVPTAALTLEVSAGLTPTGSVGVCYRDPEGAPFDRLEADLTAMLQASRPVLSRDRHGYTWIVLSASDDTSGGAGGSVDLGGLVTDLHAVTTTLQMEGFGPNILCDLVPFSAADGRVVALVYLPKRGTFYPFAPQRGPAAPGFGGATAGGSGAGAGGAGGAGGAAGGSGQAQTRDNALELQVRAIVSNELPIESDVSRWFAVWDAPVL